MLENLTHRKLIQKLNPIIKKLREEVEQELQDIKIGVEGEKAGYIGAGDGKVDDPATVAFIKAKQVNPASFSATVKAAQESAANKRQSPQPGYEPFLKLSDEELVGVILYTGPSAYAMNAILRGSLVSEYWNVYKRWIGPALQGIEKLPDATATNLHDINIAMGLGDEEDQQALEQARKTGVVPDRLKPYMLDPQKGPDDIITISTVYRVNQWGDAFNQTFASFKVGSTYEELGFSSTSIVKGSYAGPGMPVMMTITDVEQARSVMQVSEVQSEKEVLLPPGSIFRIQGITPYEDGTQKPPLRPGHKPTDRYPLSDKSPTAFNQPGLTWEVTLKHLSAPKVGEKVQKIEEKVQPGSSAAPSGSPSKPTGFKKMMSGKKPKERNISQKQVQQASGAAPPRPTSKPENLGSMSGKGDQGWALPQQSNLQRSKKIFGSAREMSHVLELEQDPPKPGQNPDSSQTSEEDSVF